MTATAGSLLLGLVLLSVGICVANPTEKVEVCPPSIAACRTPLPPPKCKSDSQCPGKQMCCAPLCIKQCTDPIVVKPGICPVSVTMCKAFPSPKPKCEHDGQCPGNKKCCTPVCRQECTDPIIVKSGHCPIPRTRCMAPPPPALCTTDSQCPGDKKCCILLCRQECTDPIFLEDDNPLYVPRFFRK
ncbi:hypothetical protein FKM82_017723 [Ascaphus truei]